MMNFNAEIAQWSVSHVNDDTWPVSYTFTVYVPRWHHRSYISLYWKSIHQIISGSKEEKERKT